MESSLLGLGEFVLYIAFAFPLWGPVVFFVWAFLAERRAVREAGDYGRECFVRGFKVPKGKGRGRAVMEVAGKERAA